MKAKSEKSWWNRAMLVLGATMVLAGIGCAVLFFVGPPGGSAGGIPIVSNAAPDQESSTTTSDPAPAQEQRQAKGPADKTLYLTVPKIGLTNVKVHDSLSEEKLEESAIHVPGTGFPWQQSANTYIAGHRLGFYGTDSFLVFLRLNELESGDEIILKDSTGEEYLYRAAGAMVVTPEDVEVLNPVAGKSIVSLQTCTFPDFANRLLVRGELVG